MKAIIPVAGAGTKLRPLTYTQPKPLIPVAGKPILGHIIEQIKAAGIEEFIFVIGYLGDKIHDYVRTEYPMITAYFVQQSERKGIGHAIWTARNLIDNGPLLIALGDGVFDTDLSAFMASKQSALGIKKVDDPRNFGVAEMSSEGRVTRVVEKPSIPKSNMALVGLYKINETKQLLSALEQHIREEHTTHNEIQLTDAIGQLIEEGVNFEAIKVNNWYDCGKRDSLLEVNALLLKKFEKPVKVSPAFENTIIVPPVNIGQDCSIKNSIIGPNVTIGKHSTMEHCIISDSIIGSYSRLREVVLNHSVVGSDAAIKGNTQSLNIGDNTEVDL